MSCLNLQGNCTTNAVDSCNILVCAGAAPVRSAHAVKLAAPGLLDDGRGVNCGANLADSRTREQQRYSRAAALGGAQAVRREPHHYKFGCVTADGILYVLQPQYHAGLAICRRLTGICRSARVSEDVASELHILERLMDLSPQQVCRMFSSSTPSNMTTRPLVCL